MTIARVQASKPSPFTHERSLSLLKTRRPLASPALQSWMTGERPYLITLPLKGPMLTGRSPSCECVCRAHATRGWREHLDRITAWKSLGRAKERPAGCPAERSIATRGPPDAESARGISPRAAHRTGREPLDSSGSCHPMKAGAFRRYVGFLRLPVDPKRRG
jgi:hypothetical protein